MKINKIKYLTVLEQIELINKAPTRTERIKVLQDVCQANKSFPEILNYAYNPYLSFGIDSFEMGEPMEDYTDGVPLKRILKELMPNLVNRSLSDDRAKEKLNLTTDKMNKSNAEALKRIIERDLRCDLTINEINASSVITIPEYPVAKRTKWTSDIASMLNYPLYVQPFHGGLFLTLHYKAKGFLECRDIRGGLVELPSFYHKLIKESFSQISDIVLSGELVIIENQKIKGAKEVGKLLTKYKKGKSEDKENSLVLFLNDIVLESNFAGTTSSVDYKARLGLLASRLKQPHDTRMRLVTNQEVFSVEHIEKIYEQELAVGGEAIIVRDPNTRYKSDLSDNLMIRNDKECSMYITNIHKGTGRYLGKLEALSCESEDGKLHIMVNRGFTNSDREVLNTEDVIGSIVTLSYSEFQEDAFGNGVLLFPSFVRVDKRKKKATKIEDL